MEESDLVRIVRLEMQTARLLSHIESEKGTAERTSTNTNRRFELLENRVQELEKVRWKAMGIVSAISTIATLMIDALVRK